MSWGAVNNSPFNSPSANISAPPSPQPTTPPPMTVNASFPVNQNPMQTFNNISPLQSTSTAAPSLLSSRAVGSKRYRGVVVYYTTTKGFGFAHTEKPEMWKIYIHIYALEKCGVADLEVGMELEFNVRENHKGKYACNVCPVFRDAEGRVVERESIPVAIPMLEGRHRGTLKSFDSQRLFGWVMCGDTEVFMTIYELRHDNMEQHLVQGTVLEFTVGKHGRGLTAYDIEVMQSAAVLGMNNQINLTSSVVTPPPPAPQQLQMGPCVALPLGSNNNNQMSSVGSTSPSPFLPTPGIVQSLTQEQINALITATLLNSTQAWQFLPLSATQCISTIPSMPNNIAATASAILLQTQAQQNAEKLAGVSGAFFGEGPSSGGLASGVGIGGQHSSTFPSPLFGSFASGLSASQQTQQQQGPSKSPSSPLLRLPSMSTHSPLQDRTNKKSNTNEKESGPCVGWDDLSCNGSFTGTTTRKSSLSSLFEGCRSSSSSSLDTNPWPSALTLF